MNPNLTAENLAQASATELLAALMESLEGKTLTAQEAPRYAKAIAFARRQATAELQAELKLK